MHQSIYSPTIRFSLSGIVAVVITFFLFFLMQYLIENSGNNELDESAAISYLDFVHLKGEHLPPKEPYREKPVKPMDPPPVPIIETTNQLDPEGTISKITHDEGTFNPANDNPFIPTINTELISIVEMQPVYPQKAIARNIEGYVVVEFSVTKYGTTEDIRVVEAQPESIFDQAAIRATSRSKYKPQIVAGKPVAVTGVQKMFRFEFED